MKKKLISQMRFIKPKMNVYVNTEPSIEYGNMTQAKKKVNELYLIQTLNATKVNGFWFWLDEGIPFKVIKHKGIHKFECNKKQYRALLNIVSKDWLSKYMVRK